LRVHNVSWLCHGWLQFHRNRSTASWHSVSIPSVPISCRVIALFVFRKPLFISKLYRIYVCYTNITLYIAFGIISGTSWTGPAFGWGERGPCPGRWLRGFAETAVTDRPRVNT
jgi:hypothetical protein